MKLHAQTSSCQLKTASEFKTREGTGLILKRFVTMAHSSQEDDVGHVRCLIYI
jgi:hypothetical protein